MKNKILILAIITLFITACGINKTANDNTEEDKLNILTTFYPVHIFAQNVVDGVEDVELDVLDIQSDGCLHGYQLTAGNMKAIEKADIIIINGADMEKSFIYDVKERYPQKVYIDSSEGISLLNSKHENEVNSHIWLSVENAKVQVENITKGLSRTDEKNSYIYTENANKYINELDKLVSEYENANINVVAMHDSVSYFAKDLGLNVIDIIQSGEDDVPTPKRNIEIIKNMKDNNVKVILLEKDTSDELATLFADETGAKIYYYDVITKGDSEKDDYIEKMKSNYALINEVREEY